MRVHVAEARHHVAPGAIDDAHPAGIQGRGRAERADHAVGQDHGVIGELVLGVERQNRDVRQSERTRLAPRKLERQELR